MRIDSYMTPKEAQKWWKANGGGVHVPPPRVNDWKPRWGTPQELYRLKKQVTIERVIKLVRCSGDNLYPFERGKVKESSDIGWLRLAYFYGVMVKSVTVKRKTSLWRRYEEEYAKLSGESEHRRIRVAARTVVMEHDARRDAKIEENKKHKIVERPRVYYRQASLCTGGIY